MIWLLAIFRSLALWMKRSGLITGNTDHDRRVFLQTFAALGGAALFRNVPAPDQSMPVVNISTVMWFPRVVLNDHRDYSHVYVKQEELDALLADKKWTTLMDVVLPWNGQPMDAP